MTHFTYTPINPHVNGGYQPTLNFYPWTVDWRTVIEIIVGGFLTVIALYLWLRAAREHPDEEPDGTEPPVHTYSGVISQGYNSTPVFLILWYVFLGLWALGYLLNAMFNGGLRY